MEDDNAGPQYLGVGGPSTDLCKPLKSMEKFAAGSIDSKR